MICGGAVDGSNQLGAIVTCQAMTTWPAGRRLRGDGHGGGEEQRHAHEERRGHDTVDSESPEWTHGFILPHTGCAWPHGLCMARGNPCSCERRVPRRGVGGIPRTQNGFPVVTRWGSLAPVTRH